MQQLVELQSCAGEYATDGKVAEDEYFFAEQNARLVKNAEEYYRSMFHGRVSSWNLRDSHMAETLDALVAHLDKHGSRTKVVVCAHNSHLSDARAIDAGRSGEWNSGQLVRERHGAETFNIGFTTYSGSVTAADNWDEPPKRKRVNLSPPGTYEELSHDTGLPRFLLLLREGQEATWALRESRLERATGVIYRPETERISHYFNAQLPDQFNAVIHIDATRAVEPLDQIAGFASAEPPEAFPSGI